MAIDIGLFLFRDILQMNYPSAPFTGVIIKDLILFFFIPTVFIIFFVYIILGFLIHTRWRGLRILMGLALYLFIIVQGYFGTFAALTGPYFIVLIFVLGLIYFVQLHFRGQIGSATATMPAGGHGMESRHNDRPYINWSDQELNDELKRIVREIESWKGTQQGKGAPDEALSNQYHIANMIRQEMQHRKLKVPVRLPRISFG